MARISIGGLRGRQDRPRESGGLEADSTDVDSEGRADKKDAEIAWASNIHIDRAHGAMRENSHAIENF